MAQSAYTAKQVSVPVSFGELVDKITILEIKAARITAPAKLELVQRELSLLQGVLNDLGTAGDADIAQLTRDLAEVNTKLWDVEDDLRECERKKDFGPVFVQLARDVYFTNDRRAELKLKLNQKFGSDVVEVKSYAAY